MIRIFGLALAATTAFVIPAMAAAQSDRIRGTVESVDQTGMTVQTPKGDKVMPDSVFTVLPVGSTMSS